MSLLSTASWVVVAAPDPGTGKAPPGSDKLVTVLSWAAWVALALCVLGVIVTGAMMAVQHRHGGGGEHAARLGWVLAACIIIGSASALVGALV